MGFPFEPVFLSVRVRGIEPIFALTYEQMAQFYACVYWPWDVMMMLFNELYTMTVPLLVPDRHWVVNTLLFALRSTDQNWWHIRGPNVRGSLPLGSNNSYPLAYLPWFDGDESNAIASATYWYSLTDFEQLPHLTSFRSFPELLNQLEALDVEDVRARMQEHNQEALDSSLHFYRWAAAALLGVPR